MKKDKVADLKHAAYNPRKISREKLLSLKDALLEFGDLSGIVFNRRSGNLVGGHQRCKVIPPDAEITITQTYDPPTRIGTVAEGYIIIAGERYSYREVDWDDVREKAANLAANKHGGEWDDKALQQIIKELSEMPDIDIGLTGFNDKELQQILNEFVGNEGLTDPDEVPEIFTEPITKTGDIYILGAHRLLCGDSLIPENVSKLMGGGKADMVFTDPPYGMNLDTNFGSMVGLGEGKKHRPVIGDDKPFDPSFIFKNVNCKEIFLWGADYYSEKIPARINGSWFVWDKQGGGNGYNDDYDKMFGSNFELCWSKQKHKRALIRILWKGFFGLEKDDTKTRIHPTQKPTELTIWFLDKFSQIGNIILDLFLGFGSTLIACEKTSRKCYGMEIDPYYCDVIVQRWEKFTGKKAILDSNRETLDFVSSTE